MFNQPSPAAITLGFAVIGALVALFAFAMGWQAFGALMTLVTLVWVVRGVVQAIKQRRADQRA